MSAFLDKSQQNLTAAQLLIENALPNVSLHCSYYAVVQRMLHVLFFKMGVNKQQFDADKRNNNDGTHSYANKLISIDLAKKNRDDFKWYQREFPALKKKREQADYQKEHITRDEAIEATSKAKSLINILAQNFK